MRHHDMPARNITNAPLTPTSSAVPRSGCSAIRPAGTPISTAQASSAPQLGGSMRSCRNQATIIGSVSFASSEGWKRTTPRSSQRCAPRPSPNSVTSSSRTTVAK